MFNELLDGPNLNIMFFGSGIRVYTPFKLPATLYWYITKAINFNDSNKTMRASEFSLFKSMEESKLKSKQEMKL